VCIQPAEKSVLIGKMLSLSAISKSTLHDAAVSDKSALNPQLMQNAVGCGCQPSDVLVQETVPQDFVEINDNSEIQSQHVGKKDEYSMSRAPVDCSVTSVEHDIQIVGDLTSRTCRVQPNIVMTSSEKTGPSSPILNHRCQFPIPVAVSSSPSLFDDDEEKRLPQRNVSKNLLSSSENNVVTTSHIRTGVSQPSPSVLSRKLGVNVSAHHTHEKKYQENVDHEQPTLPSLMQTAVNERESLQTVSARKCSDSCDCNAKMKLNTVQGSNKILPTEYAIHMNDADHKLCCMQTLDVPTEDIPVACAIDILAVSATRTVNEQNLLAAAAKLSQQDITSSACNSADVMLDFRQPLPKKRRHEEANSSSPHAVRSDSTTQDNSKFFCA